jgi:hypothetical protein
MDGNEGKRRLAVPKGLSLRQFVTYVMALALAAMSLGFIVASPAGATGDTVDNKDCPEGYTFLVKFEWNETTGEYEPEGGDSMGVTLDADAEGGSFTSVEPIGAVTVKASTDDKYVFYVPAVTEGEFDNDGLVTPSGNEPEISHLTFCTPPEEPPYECPDGTVWTDTDGDGKVDEGECHTPPPPYECPDGTVWTDTDGDGKVDEGECHTPPPPPVPPVVTPPVVTPPVVVPPVVTPPELKPVKPAVKKLDKCELNNFLWIKKHRGYVAFNAKTGKRLPEGSYFAVGKKVIKVKFVAKPGYELLGKRVIKVVFRNQEACSPDVVTTPPTGLRAAAG